MPAGMATIQVMTKANSASSTVSTSRSPISSELGRWYSSERPRSPLSEALHPAEILDVDRLVEPELLLERLDLRRVHGGTRGGQRGHVAGQEIARRRLDQREDDDREQEQQHGSSSRRLRMKRSIRDGLLMKTGRREKPTLASRPHLSAPVENLLT